MVLQKKRGKKSPKQSATDLLRTGFENPDVLHFIQKKSEYENLQTRRDKMKAIQNDNKFLDDMNQDSVLSHRPKIKSSLEFKILQVFSQNTIKFPKVEASSKGLTAEEREVLDGLKDIAIEDADIKQVWRDVVHGFKTEGTSIVQTSYEKKVGDKRKHSRVVTTKCDLADVYFDSTCTHFASKSRTRDNSAKIVIYEARLASKQVKALYPGSMVLPGSPVEGYNRYQDVNSKVYDETLDKTDTTSLFYCYDVTDPLNPKYIVFGGSNAEILEDSSGDKYPFWEYMYNGEKVSYLPFADFHFSSEKRGFYSLSIIGMLKDLSNAYRNALFTVYPQFARIVNPWIMMFGTVNERVKEQMRMAEEMQLLGKTKIIPAGETSMRMESIKPSSGVFNDFEAYRQNIFRDASMRFAINVQELEEIDQTATEFLGKSKTQKKALSAIYEINAPSIERWIKMATDQVVQWYRFKGDDRVITITYGDSGLDKEDFSVDEAATSLRDAPFHFVVESDIKIPRSTADDMAVRQQLSVKYQTVFYSIPFNSLEEIEIELEDIHKLAIMVDLEDQYSMRKLRRKAELILQARIAGRPLLDTSQFPSGNASFGGLQNDEVARELSPQSSLASAGV